MTTQIQTIEGMQIARTGETAMTSAAETAKAMVQSRFLVAINRPRNFEECRIRILEACRRPRFAEMARYKKPTGGKFIEGMSIRFADEAVKVFGNTDTRHDVTYEDDEQRIIQVSVTDLETNLTKSGTVCVRKTVERREPKKGVDIVGERMNTEGKKVYIVKATDDELFNKEQNLCAKIRRNLELQLIPQDLIEECEDEITKTMQSADKENPDSAKQRIFDGFAKIGIMPRAIEEYLGHSTSSISPAEFQTLRGIGAALRDGQTTWAEIMETKNGGSETKADPFAPGRHKLPPKRENSQEEPAPMAPNAEPQRKDSAVPDKEFSSAFGKLSINYEEHSETINAALRAAKIGVEFLLDIAPDCKDEKVIRAVVEIAKGF